MYLIAGANQEELNEPQITAHQAKEMAQLHSSRIASSMGYLQERNSSSEIATKNNEDNHVKILKDTSNNNDIPSYIRHFNILMN